MTPLSSDDILFLLRLLEEEEVVPRTDAFPFRITRQGHGYRDGEAGRLQAKLSIMLEVAGKRGRT